jgi:serine/threonine-protein kinase
MSRSRHQQIQELFLAAVDLDPEERAGYLDKACQGDEELIREIEELLAADGAVTTDPPADSVSNARGLIEGTGTYRVLSEIGRGGMGVVYLAERADGAFQRHVAIKVVMQPAGAESELVSRFRSERQILATMDHPNIACLLDGGTLPDGSPFLVMEHVEGETIHEYARSHALPVEARLELFIAVCDAVQAAHQSLVVHRDIKPSNVLVTRDGTPKLLDFGVAKILDPRLADWTVAETRFGHQPLTPRYASPEQLTGGPITTATDVYALGILLYELLTGCLPYRAESSAIHDWIEAVCEHEPRRPSQALRAEEPERQGETPILKGSLEGDVDHIVLKALRKEPHNRYATAAELAADLRRHMAGLPIQARPATLSYRTGKFIRRHRWMMAAVLALVMVAGGFTIGLVHQLERTRIERDRAETVKSLLIEVFGTAGPGTVEGSELTARELLDRGLERVQAGLDDQPEVKATLLNAIGQVYHNLGRLEEAAAAHEQALELLQPRRQTVPLEYAQSLGFLARIYLVRNQLEQAETMTREAWEVTVALAGEEDHRAIAYLDSLVTILSQTGRLQEAEALARQVVELTLRRLGHASVESVVASDSQSPELVAVATTLGSLGSKQRQLGQYRDAKRSLQQALTLNRRLLGADHFSVAFNLSNLANLHAELEEYQLALAERQEALRVAEAVLGTAHPSVGGMHLNQGIVLARLGRFDEALVSTSRALQIFADSLGSEHPVSAMAMSASGLVESGLGHHDQALALAHDALDLLLQAYGETHPEVARALEVLAQVNSAMARHTEAVVHFQQALASFEASLGREHPDTLECRSRMAEPLLAMGRYEQARKLLEPALSALEARGDLVRRLARVRFRLARALAGDEPAGEEATSMAEQALANYRELGDQIGAAEVTAWLGGGSP